MLDERAEKIEHGIKAAEIARVEIDAERADLADQIRDAHRDAEQIREKATANAKAIVADAQEQATLMLTRSLTSRTGVSLQTLTRHVVHCVLMWAR